ncbi:DUF4175 family protein, partial [Bosea sp. (in: a-proteobacteria)]
QRDWADGRVRVPGADESATQRARRILEELRRRLGDPSRPMEELDYLERLLRRNCASLRRLGRGRGEPSPGGRGQGEGSAAV